MKNAIIKAVVLTMFCLTLVSSLEGKPWPASSSDTTSPAQSLAIGYSTCGLNVRYDLFLSGKVLKRGTTHLYLEIGGEKLKFNEPNFSFNKINYSSDCRKIFGGIGLAQEYIRGRIHFTPFAGLRFAYVRFTDRALVNAIGTNGLQRYKDAALTQPVGPPVENAYGDAASFDLGCRLGVQLTNKIELGITTGYSPLEFDTSSTLFGEYWGEAPYPNKYRVKINSIRFELSLRIRF